MSNSDSVPSLVSGSFAVLLVVPVVLAAAVILAVAVVLAVEPVLLALAVVLAVVLVVVLAVGLALVEFRLGFKVDFAFENWALYLFKVILFVPYSNVPLPCR